LHHFLILVLFTLVLLFVLVLLFIAVLVVLIVLIVVLFLVILVLVPATCAIVMRLQHLDNLRLWPQVGSSVSCQKLSPHCT
jgi:hypothetical protein